MLNLTFTAIVAICLSGAAAGRLVAQFDATGTKIDLAARDTAAGKEVVKDRRGNSTTYEYDAIGNVSKVTDAASGITSYTYDARGNEATVANPLGHVTTRTFDGDDNPLTEKDPAGNTTTYAWKPRSRDLASITDARGNLTEMGYTVTGRKLPRRVDSFKLDFSGRILPPGRFNEEVEVQRVADRRDPQGG